MYSTPPVDSGASGLLGLLFAGSAMTLLLVLIVVLIGALFAYALIKAAVRQGVIEAIRKTGLNTGGSSFVNGYPPVQSYGAPVAPSAEHIGYGGPIG